MQSSSVRFHDAVALLIMLDRVVDAVAVAVVIIVALLIMLFNI